jgi:hypothetical protein
LRSIAIRLGVAALGVTALSAGLTAGAASAQAEEVTSTTVTITPASTVSAQALKVHAAVTFTKIKHTPITGTITFSATDHMGNPVELNCKAGDSVAIPSNGKAECLVPAGTLFAVDGPYTINAAYSGSGDGNFLASAGSATATPGQAASKITLKMNPLPVLASNASQVAIATVTAGPGTAGLSGTVTFAITSSDHNVTLDCTNSVVKGKLQLPLSGGTAQCDLPAKWLIIPAASKGNKHPYCAWSVTAFFSPSDSSYLAPLKGATKQGKAHS